MLATSLFHVNGAADPSSKKDLGSVAAYAGPPGGFVKEVFEVPMIGIDVMLLIDRLAFENGSFRDRVIGDMPLMESMDVAGDTPSEMCDRRFFG